MNVLFFDTQEMPTTSHQPRPVDLPIHQVRERIVQTLQQGNRLVLTAPTGSGKSTQVPGMLLDAGLVKGQVIVLQPRRLAARVLAQRVAYERGSKPGEEVGYQTRYESVVSPQTRLRFVTEGLFLRLLQNDPLLKGVGAVVLDEFHERNLPADLTLALVKRLQAAQRPDLKLVVMSATLATQQVAAYLHAPIIEAHGRLYPVDVQYLSQRPAGNVPIWETAAQTVGSLLQDANEQRWGDVLVFMPGVYEIHKTIEAARKRVSDAGIHWHGLYGEMPSGEQDAVLTPGAPGQRKVIVATNIAETSITLPGDPGVRAVVDSGLVRMNRMDHRRGINVLMIEPVSKASAQQRAGRAGRTGPGVCVRLWTEFENKTRAEQTQPEVLRVDLAQVVLQVLSMDLPGVTSVEALREFDWLDKPGDLAMDGAVEVLTRLGAIAEKDGSITQAGRSMSALPMHPRLAGLMIEATKLGCEERAALWAALISERDIVLKEGWQRWVQQTGEKESDLMVLEAAYTAAEKVKFDVGACSRLGLHAAACREVERTRALYRQSVRGMGDSSEKTGNQVKKRPHPHPLPEGEGTKKRPHLNAGGPNATIHAEAQATLQRCLLAGYPDHVAVYKGGAHRACVLMGERRGVLDETSVVADEPGVILALEVIEVGGQRTAARRAMKDSALLTGGPRTVLSLANRVSVELLQNMYPRQVQQEKVTQWNPSLRCVEVVEQLRFDDFVLEEKPRGEKPTESAAATMLAAKIRDGEIKLHTWDQQVEQWLARVRCLANWFPEKKLLRYDEDDLQVIYEELCSGAVRASQVEDRPVLEAVKNALSWEEREWVERVTPTNIRLPGADWKGRPMRLKVSYAEGQPPTGRAKIQELYGLEETPTVAEGRVRLRLEILGPNYRPVQMTEDLAGFWKNLYPVLKKELQRKYPRHEWR